MNMTRRFLWLCAALAAIGLLMAPCFGATTNILWLTTNTTLNPTDRFLIGVNSGSSNLAKNVSWAIMEKSLTNVAAAVATNVAGSVSSGPKTVWVSPTGNNATAVRGRMDKPFASLSNAVAVATNGDVVRVLPGFYTNSVRLITGASLSNSAPVILRRLTNVTIDMTGAYIYLTNNFDFIWINNCKDIWLKGGTIDGQKPPLFTPLPDFMTNGINVVFGAINITDSDGVHGRDMTIKNVHDHGWLVDGPNRTFASTNGSVIGCTFSGIGGYYANGNAWGDGDAIIPGAGWTIANNIITDCSRGIEVYPLGSGSPGVMKFPTTTISGNIIRNIYDHALMLSYASCAVVGNSISTTNPSTDWAGTMNNDNTGIAMRLVPSAMVVGNTIKGFSTGIQVVSATNVVALANFINECLFGVVTSNVEDFSCDDNSFVLCRNAYILSPGGILTNGSISGNSFKNCGTYNASWPGVINGGTTKAWNIRIEDNYFNNYTNTAFAIWLTNSQGCSAIGNRFSSFFATNSMIPSATNVVFESDVLITNKLTVRTASITAGTAAPSVAEPNGSLYLRDNGTLYLRTNGAWIIK